MSVNFDTLDLIQMVTLTTTLHSNVIFSTNEIHKRLMLFEILFCYSILALL